VRKKETRANSPSKSGVTRNPWSEYGLCGGRGIYVKIKQLKLTGKELYYTNSLSILVKNMLCSKTA